MQRPGNFRCFGYLVRGIKFGMLRSLEIALGFLTVFKVRVEPPPDSTEIAGSAWTFPVVGAILGLLLAAGHAVAVLCFPASVTAVLVVVAWVFLTGGLHLDGWADCWDALAASVPLKDRYEILKDSRVGTFGVVAVLSLLAVKTTAIAAGEFSAVMLFLAPAIGRGVMLIAASGAVHRGDGMGALFLSALNKPMLRWVTGITVVLALLGGWKGLVALGAAYLGSLWFRRLAESRIGVINGDVLGGMCELSEAIVLLVACASP